MNKKKFKKQLDYARKSGFISLYSIVQLFKNEKKSLFNNENIEKLIGDNFPEIMGCIGSGNVDSLVNTLYAYDSMKPFFKKEKTIKYILDNVEYHDFNLIVNQSDIKELVQEFIHSNFDYVLRNYSMKKIVPIYERMELDQSELSKIEKYFNDKKQEFLEETLTKTLSFKGNVDEQQLDALLGVVTKVIDNTLEKENCKMTDIKILMSGAFSNVLRIGDSIIKVGIPRKTFNIPNDKRILQPYLRRDLSENFGIEATIEVSDRVDTDISLSEDELYEIYKDMRSRGVVCGDFKYDNIGKLIKPNTPRNKVSNGMVGEVNETLDVGEYVLIDTDFIYRENDPNLNLSSDLSRKFEARYKSQMTNKGR